MALINQILFGDRGYTDELRSRASGAGPSLAAMRGAMGQASNAGASVAARAQDAGTSPALAARIGAETTADAAGRAGAQYVQTASQEMRGARDALNEQLQGRKDARAMFRGNVLGMVGQLGGLFGSLKPGGGGPGGLPTTSGTSSTSPLGGVGAAAGTAVGGPLGGMLGSALGNAVGGGVPPSAAAPQGVATTSLVDKAIASMPVGSAPVTAPSAMTNTDGLSNDELLTWLMSRGRGG